MYEVITDTIRRTQNSEGRTIDVRPWPDAPNFVQLVTEGEDNIKYFGEIELPMEPEFARKIGEALIACANEIDISSSQ